MCINASCVKSIFVLTERIYQRSSCANGGNRDLFVVLSRFFNASPIAISSMHILSSFSIPAGESVKSLTVFTGSKRVKIVYAA